MKDDERRLWRAVEEPPDDTEGHAGWTVEVAGEGGDAEARGSVGATDDTADDENDDTRGHLRF